MIERALAIALALATLGGPARAQDSTPEALAEERQEIVAFEFAPEVGEAWREIRTERLVLTWESARAESAVTESLYAERTWQAVDAVDGHTHVRWSFGETVRLRDGKTQPAPLEHWLAGRRFTLRVDRSGEAHDVLELPASGSRENAPGEPPAPPFAGALVPAPPVDTTALALLPRGYRSLEEYLVNEWNERAAAFQGQTWGQGESFFEVERIELPGVGRERLFTELWFEERADREGRPLVRIELRHFSAPGDTVAVETEALAEFLEVAGLREDAGPPLTDFLAAGRGTWWLDPARLVVVEGAGEVQGLVLRWPSADSPAAASARLSWRTRRSAEPAGSTSRRSD